MWKCLNIMYMCEQMFKYHVQSCVNTDGTPCTWLNMCEQCLNIMFMCKHSLNIMSMCEQCLNIMSMCEQCLNIMFMCEQCLNSMFMCEQCVNIMFMCKQCLNNLSWTYKQHAYKSRMHNSLIKGNSWNFLQKKM
jgi:hypothetical protein